MKNLVKNLLMIVVFCNLFGVQNSYAMSKEDLNRSLSDAIGDRNLAEIKLLVELGADLNESAGSKRYRGGASDYEAFWNLPLDNAILCGFPDVYELLLKLGADPYERYLEYGKWKNQFDKAKRSIELSTENSGLLQRRQEIVKILDDYDAKRKAEIREALLKEGVIQDLINIVSGYADVEPEKPVKS